jgi:hypothetical protein
VVKTGRRSPIDDNAVRRFRRNQPTARTNVAVNIVPCVRSVVKKTF